MHILCFRDICIFFLNEKKYNKNTILYLYFRRYLLFFYKKYNKFVEVVLV